MLVAVLVMMLKFEAEGKQDAERWPGKQPSLLSSSVIRGKWVSLRPYGCIQFPVQVPLCWWICWMALGIWMLAPANMCTTGSHHPTAFLTPAVHKNSTDCFWKLLFPIAARLLAILRRGRYWINGRRVHSVAEFPSRQRQASLSPGRDAAARGGWFEIPKPDWTFWHSYTRTLPSNQANWVPMDILSG